VGCTTRSCGSLQVENDGRGADVERDPERLAAAYPSLVAAAQYLLAYDADADFEAGLRALLSGFSRESSACTVNVR